MTDLPFWVSPSQPFDPHVRAEEKRASREEDSRGLSSKAKSPEDLRAENGKFAFPNAVVNWSSARRLW